MAVPAHKRAEARTRYYTRAEAMRIGWNVQHPSRGGSFLEEQEIVDYFPTLAPVLGQQRPDFVGLLNGKLSTIIECKGDWQALDEAVGQACNYADTINEVKGYKAHLAVGVAGTPDKRVLVRCQFRNGNGWTNLVSHGYPLTQLPAPAEVELAIQNGNGTTDVILPGEREFFDAAISISRILRLAKIEEAIRPKVIGAIILALYHGEFSMDTETVIENINTNVRAAVKKFGDVRQDHRDFLAQTLELSTEAHGLRSRVEDVVHQLERLNVRSIMRSGVDFLGQFYETFLRYGQDTKKLGIVFTPRHITRMCAELVDVQLGQTVYDPACGTGGFLVAAFDKMMRQATTPSAQKDAKESLAGFDTNPTVWALAILNMFFRGDGKSHIVYGNCFQEVAPLSDLALLNPPFSQEGEPETDFVDHALKSVKPGGRVGIVLKTSVMVDPTLRPWRAALVADHQVEGVLTLPLELFYPTSSPTVVLLMKAHAPQKTRGTMVARIENDGFEISKKRRVPIPGSQIETVIELFHQHSHGRPIGTIPNLVTVVDRERIAGGDEVCAERWLPSAPFGMAEYDRHRIETFRQLSLAIANYPDVTDELLADFEDSLGQGEAPTKKPTNRAPLREWFTISNGRSSGSKNYAPGSVPYISSGDSYNGIVTFVEPHVEEAHGTPCVTVSAFGQACIQPWRFCARGNGGSAVRVLKPRFAMTLPELIWLVGQINAQRWRFHYGRMAIPDRLRLLRVDPPPADLPLLQPLREKLLLFRRGLDILIDVQPGSFVDELEDARDVEIAIQRLREIEDNPTLVVSGDELVTALDRLTE